MEEPEPEVQPSMCLPSFGTPPMCSDPAEFHNGYHLLPTPEPTNRCYEIGVGPMKDCGTEE